MQGSGAVLGTLLDGRYQVDSVLARGGMSTVYRGLDTRLDRPVAIKVMDPRFAGDPSFLDRFIREAKATARLRHPAVVAVHDQGVEHTPTGDQVFLVMELVEGGTLRDLIRSRGPLPVPLALSVLEPVLSALAAAHREGLVHRDIKPENVLIGRGGEVKVADFGLVRAMAEASSTSDSVILGTVAYLSPEQVATGVADAASDVYSAGVLLYEMLTGAPPYAADTPLSVAYRHVNEDMPPPGEANPEVPPALDQLTMRATRRDPSERPPDAAAFLVALQRLRGQLDVRRAQVPVPVTPADTPAGDTVPARVGYDRDHDHRDHLPDPERTDRHEPVPDVRREVGPLGTRAYDRPGPIHHPSHQHPHPNQVPPQPTPKPTPAEAYHQQRVRDRRVFLVWMLIVLVVALLVAAGAWYMALGRWTAVPELNNLDRSGVEQALQDAGLEPVLLADHHDVVPAGQLVSVRPAPGTRILRGEPVRAVLSEGRPRVPEIAAGIPLEQATALLTGADLQLARDESADRYHDSVPEGGVLGVRPPPGTELTVGAEVTLVLSKGPPPVDVPDVRGKTVDEAAAALASAGLAVAEQPKQAFDPEVPGGRVIGTDPAGGRTVRKGDQVTIVVSNALQVPDVLGRSRDEALQALQEAGFDPQATGDNVEDERARVVATDPAIGALVDPEQSTRITVTLAVEVTVPDVVGRTVDEAKAMLAQAGLRADVQQWFGDGSSRVIAQSPNPGDRLPPGSAVALTAL